MADAQMVITDWRVRDGALDDAPEHHWPALCTEHATSYGGLSVIVDRTRGDAAPEAGKVEVYIEREGDALLVRVFAYDETGVPDDEPRATLRVGADNSIS